MLWHSPSLGNCYFRGGYEMEVSGSIGRAFIANSGWIRFAFRCLADSDRPDPGIRAFALEIYIEQPAIGFRRNDLNPLGQNEGSLKLPRRDSAMEIDSLGIFGLFAFDDQLIGFNRHRKIVLRKPGDGQCDPKRDLRNLFDIVRWVAATGGFRYPVKGALKMIETKKERRAKKR